MPDQNRFLHGPFAPVEEELTVFDLPVTGSVPAGLSGRYLRNGPNPLGLEDPGYRFWEGHWFLGPGMVHGVRLRDGKAEWYRNSWVRSRLLAEALGETWQAGPVHADMDFAANTHIIAHAGRLLATVEAGPLPYQLSGELDTLGPCDFGGTLPGRPFQRHGLTNKRSTVARDYWDCPMLKIIGDATWIGSTVRPEGRRDPTHEPREFLRL